MQNIEIKTAGETIFERSMAALGLAYDMSTDPVIMKDVMREFRLNDLKTENERMAEFFRSIVSEPQKLLPLFENISRGIVTKHPAILEFADLAIKDGWLRPSEHIIRSVHAAYLLEAMTAAMCNSHGFFVEAHDHYKAKEREHGIDPKHAISTLAHVYYLSHDLFETIKSLSVDPAMIYFRIQRGLDGARMKEGEAKDLLRDKKINYLEYRLLSPLRKGGLENISELIRLNIYEAGVTEYEKGLKTNAISAHELSEDIKINPPRTRFEKKSVLPEYEADEFYRSIVEKDNLFPVFEFTQEWVSLYITWNLAFVLKDLDDQDILFPKLFIPSIINAESGNFMGARIISLWLSINHAFYRKLDKKLVAKPKNKTEMALAWAKINKKYAFDLSKRETHEDSKILIKGYRRFFSRPFLNLFRIAYVLIR